MSYILDALRRADSDRERGSVPDIHARQVPQASIDARAAPPRLALWGGAALLVLLAGVLAWLLIVREPPRAEGVAIGEAASRAAALPAPVVPPAAAPTLAATRPAAPVPAQVPVAAPAPKAQRQPVVVAAAKASAPEPRLYTIAELPDDIRRELPALAIGGAMYSENAASRMLIVNGQLVHERDRLAPGLVLVQIKLKSAVLEFKGYRYGISF